MKTTFADTFYFLGLLNPKDAAHGKALAASKALSGMIVTTAWVLTELGDALCDPEDRGEFLALLEGVRNSSRYRIIDPDATLFEEGINLFRQRPDKDWSLTDCISFVVMSCEGISEALTGDHHFEQAGFAALLK